MLPGIYFPELSKSDLQNVNFDFHNAAIIYKIKAA